MSWFDVFSLFVLFVVIAVLVGILLVLAWLPGSIARKRRSPWAEAINVAGWIGVVLPPIWMLALIASFVRPSVGEGAAVAITESETAELAASIQNISRRLENLEREIRELQPRTAAQRAGG